MQKIVFVNKVPGFSVVMLHYPTTVDLLSVYRLSRYIRGSLYRGSIPCILLVTLAWK